MYRLPPVRNKKIIRLILYNSLFNGKRMMKKRIQQHLHKVRCKCKIHNSRFLFAVSDALTITVGEAHKCGHSDVHAEEINVISADRALLNGRTDNNEISYHRQSQRETKM